MSVSSSSTKRVFVFQGTFLIPGSPTREKADFGPVKVAACSPQMASRDLAPILRETFKKELPHHQTFSNDFALYHLGWKELSPVPQKVRTGGIAKVKVAGPVVSTETIVESTMGGIVNDNGSKPNEAVAVAAE